MFVMVHCIAVIAFIFYY